MTIKFVTRSYIYNIVNNKFLCLTQSGPTPTGAGTRPPVLIPVWRNSMATQLKISIIPMQEDCEPDDRSLHHDPEVVEAIKENIDRYGLWGWCTVIVRATYGQFKGNLR